MRGKGFFNKGAHTIIFSESEKDSERGVLKVVLPYFLSNFFYCLFECFEDRRLVNEFRQGHCVYDYSSPMYCGLLFLCSSVTSSILFFQLLPRCVWCLIRFIVEC